MCMISMILTDFTKQYVNIPNLPFQQFDFSYATKFEVEQLRKEVEALKDLIVAAKEYDRKTGQPDCEHKEKVELVKKIAKLVGVDLSTVL